MRAVALRSAYTEGQGFPPSFRAVNTLTALLDEGFDSLLADEPTGASARHPC